MDKKEIIVDNNEQINDKDLDTSIKLDEVEIDNTNLPEESLNTQAPVEETIVYEDNKQSNIEEARQDFLKKYKLQGTLKWIVTILSLAIIIYAWVGLGSIVDSNGDAYSWTFPVQIGLVVFSLILVFGYSFIIKIWINKKMKKYFEIYYTNSNSYVLGDGVFENIQVSIDGKIDTAAFIENELFLDVVQVGSRNKIEFVYKNVPTLMIECAGQIKTKTRLTPIFVGKYFISPCNYTSDERIVIYIKGDERSIPPTDITHLIKVHDDKKYCIYSNNPNWNKFINTKIKRAINNIKVNKDLIDVAISIKKGQMFVCAGYDDSLMVLPLQQPYNPRGTNNLKKDIVKICDLIKECN